uniref:Protein disulfide isomerase like, testis expressed n=1 Tax=Cairina moschata TaxID=8855 RepID=A0A8C3BP79_CAIMO
GTSLTVLSVALWWVMVRGAGSLIGEENNVLLLKKSNFDRVLKETKYLLVEFYAPWSHDCRKLLPIWDELGEKYKNHKDIIIAKIDVTANDILSVVLDRYPFFRLFPAGADYQVRSFRGRMGWHSCTLRGGQLGGLLHTRTMLSLCTEKQKPIKCS